MRKFKVGDRVKMIVGCPGSEDKGKITTLVKASKGWGLFTKRGCCHKNYWKLVKPATAGKPSKADKPGKKKGRPVGSKNKSGFKVLSARIVWDNLEVTFPITKLPDGTEIFQIPAGWTCMSGIGNKGYTFYKKETK